MEQDDGGRGVDPAVRDLYAEHRDAVFGFLARRLGRPAAEDAFQETFLRALRAYARLEHGRHLRAWVFTIAARVAIDASPEAELTRCHSATEPAVEDSRPAYLELEHLAQELPPTERAAVVLRYGYDLAYAEIGAALGSIGGCRATGRFLGRPAPPQEGRLYMNVPPISTARFREAAAAAGLLDVAYDVVDTPIGKLLVAATPRGLAGSRTTTSPSASSRGSRARSARVSCARRSRSIGCGASSTSTSSGDARRSSSTWISVSPPASRAAFSTSSHLSPTAR